MVKWIMNKFFVSSGVVLISALTLSACGIGNTVNQKVGNKIAEKVIESQSGGKVDVDSNGEKVTIKTDDGQTQFAAGGDVKLPDNFPKELVVADDAKLMMATSSGNSSSISYLTNSEQKTVMEKYIATLTGSGWKKEMELDTGEGKMTNFSKGKEAVTVVVGANSSNENTEKTSVMVTLVTEKEN